MRLYAIYHRVETLTRPLSSPFSVLGHLQKLLPSLEAFTTVCHHALGVTMASHSWSVVSLQLCMGTFNSSVVWKEWF